MSIPYEAVGRIHQKQRTREALVQAARALLVSGVTPTVEDAAAEASISRTTAYRYFPNQRELLAAAFPEVSETSLLADDPPEDVHERLDLAVRELLRLTLEFEPALRAMLRLSLDPAEAHEGLLLRRGRAIGWLTDALGPLRDQMSDGDVERLVMAIRSAVGIESLVWLCDVGGLSREEATDLMSWSARCLLRGALSDGFAAAISTKRGHRIRTVRRRT